MNSCPRNRSHTALTAPVWCGWSEEYLNSSSGMVVPLPGHKHPASVLIGPDPLGLARLHENLHRAPNSAHRCAEITRSTFVACPAGRGEVVEKRRRTFLPRHCPSSCLLSPAGRPACPSSCLLSPAGRLASLLTIVSGVVRVVDSHRFATNHNGSPGQEFVPARRPSL